MDGRAENDVTMDDDVARDDDVTRDDDVSRREGVHFQLLPTPSNEGNGNLDTSSLSNDLDNTDEEDNMSLLHCRYERLDLKDFHSEIRGSRDVDLALSSAVVLLDLHAYNLSQIVQSMLNSLVTCQPENEVNVLAARKAIFTSGSESVLTKTIQGTVSSVDMGGVDFDQAWICIMCDLPTLSQRHVVFARLPSPVNLGPTCQEVQLVILVLTPSKEKATKSTLETGRTFSSLFTDLSFRHQLLSIPTKEGFRNLVRQKAAQMAKDQGDPDFRRKFSHQLTLTVFDEEFGRRKPKCMVGQSMWQDLKRRLPHYWSDYKDGFVGERTKHKVLAAILFLYFACVLPNLAFGMLNSNNTKGAIGVKKILFSQMFGGLVFAIIGGQPLIVLLTTAPLALYTKIIFNISEDFDLDFRALFACVGLWNAFFLIIYSLFGVSKLMKWSSRSTEEIFSLFITFAFSADAIRDCIKDFNTNYHTEACHRQKYHPSNISNISSSTTDSPVSTTISFIASTVDSVGYSAIGNYSSGNETATNSSSAAEVVEECLRENSILFLLLMLGTVWVGLTLFNFTKTPYLTAGRREILADYALPIAVLFVSFFGSFLFRDVKLKPFEYDPEETMFEISAMTQLSPGAVFAGAGLGFCLSLLFFMDQNISSALVNTPNNKLKKGAAYHWDLFVVAIINAFLSIFSFPWVHAALPHSPLHVRALADLEERVEQGHVQQIVVHVRETRVSGIISHVLIGLSMFMLPVPLTYIPRPVLDGLFLYVAITALYGNQLFDRVLLLFTEQAAYPPNHYIRRVPQRKVHTFTALQLVQLAVLCVFGFSPIAYMKMIFPVLLMFLMPIRHKLVPRVIEPRFLKALDGH